MTPITVFYSVQYLDVQYEIDAEPQERLQML